MEKENVKFSAIISEKALSQTYIVGPEVWNVYQMKSEIIPKYYIWKEAAYGTHVWRINGTAIGGWEDVPAEIREAIEKRLIL